MTDITDEAAEEEMTDITDEVAEEEMTDTTEGWIEEEVTDRKERMTDDDKASNLKYCDNLPALPTNATNRHPRIIGFFDIFDEESCQEQTAANALVTTLYKESPRKLENFLDLSYQKYYYEKLCNDYETLVIYRENEMVIIGFRCTKLSPLTQEVVKLGWDCRVQYKILESGEWLPVCATAGILGRLAETGLPITSWRFIDFDQISRMLAAHVLVSRPWLERRVSPLEEEEDGGEGRDPGSALGIRMLNSP